ncbi:sensor histidine kinase [Roseateles sp. DB2]|uniref:sensor histidine kinase n=1 Tax=Roseateles sp. DB2 TaxID=3453717 RepID=UPI003EECDF1B
MRAAKERFLGFWRDVDWRVALMLGPRHRFTPEQWQKLQAITSLNPSIVVGGLINLTCAVLAVVHLSWRYLSGPHLTAVVLLALGLGVGTGALLLGLWRTPTMKRLYQAYAWGFLGALIAGLLAAQARRHWDLTPQALKVLESTGLMVLVLCSLGLWALATWRNEYCAQWLREQERQAEALELARRLATAQIQPHFLFNSLAALQYWVQSKDDRAAPLLGSLTGYLRATLPLFDRPLLSVAEEAEAACRYLEVMQARLGERLRFRLDIAPEAASAQLPPGVLLTLVENAVEHGVQPQLDGGEIVIQAVLDTDGLCLRVMDDGQGPAPGLDFSTASAGAARQGGLGLRNTLHRLSQTFGDRASLQLQAREAGGCAAVVRIQAA